MIKYKNIISEGRSKNYYNWMQFFGEWRGQEHIIVEYFDVCSSFITGNNRLPLENFLKQGGEQKALIDELQTWAFPNRAKLYRGFWAHEGNIPPELNALISNKKGTQIDFMPGNKFKLQHWTYDKNLAKEYAARSNAYSAINQGVLIEANIKKSMMIFSYTHLRPMIEWLQEKDFIELKKDDVTMLDFKQEKEIIVYHDKKVNAKIVYKI